MRIVDFINTGPAIVRKRLLILAVCFWLGGCGLMDDFVFSGFRTGLGRGFEGMAEMGKNVRSVGEAATAAVRPIEGLSKSMDSIGQLATNLGSMPQPGRTVEPVSPGASACGETAP